MSFATPLLHGTRHLARRTLAVVLPRLPAPIARSLRAAAETLAYRLTPYIHSLPPIFHYWSNRYLLPQFQALGFVSPEDFYLQQLREEAARRPEPLRCLSLASGRCEIEIGLAVALRDAGIATHFTCIDFNAGLLADAQFAAAKVGMAESFDFVQQDVAQLRADPAWRFDIVIANQCLHHFLELEHALDFIAASLTEEGAFLTCDVIGRNGHQLWPEALEEVQRIWRTLPRHLRRDRTRGGHAAEYVDYNHADVGFEGIRAQDILPALLQRFHFEVFCPWGGIMLPFIERRFGWNYDPQRAEDRAIIDAIAGRDAQLLAEGKVKPTQLVASMRLQPVPLRAMFPHAPKDCVRMP